MLSRDTERLNSEKKKKRNEEDGKLAWAVDLSEEVLNKTNLFNSQTRTFNNNIPWVCKQEKSWPAKLKKISIQSLRAH